MAKAPTAIGPSRYINAAVAIELSNKHDIIKTANIARTTRACIPVHCTVLLFTIWNPHFYATLQMF